MELVEKKWNWNKIMMKRNTDVHDNKKVHIRQNVQWYTFLPLTPFPPSIHGICDFFEAEITL